MARTSNRDDNGDDIDMIIEMIMEIIDAPTYPRYDDAPDTR